MSAFLNHLKTALGAESKGVWMNFMEEVEHEMPFLFSSGRPKREQIEASPIFQDGFESWNQFVTDPRGLNWSLDSWKAWKKAWNVVKENPYLRDSGMTASEINTLSREAKQASSEFPNSKDALEAHRTHREGLLEQKRADTAENLKTELKAVENSLREALAELEDTKKRLIAAEIAEKTLSTVKQKGLVRRIIWAISPL